MPKGQAGGGISVGFWIGLIVLAVVLIEVVGAMIKPLTQALTGYKLNDTTFGPILFTVVPILVGASVLLVLVFALIPGRHH